MYYYNYTAAPVCEPCLYYYWHANITEILGQQRAENVIRTLIKK